MQLPTSVQGVCMVLGVIRWELLRLTAAAWTGHVLTAQQKELRAPLLDSHSLAVSPGSALDSRPLAAVVSQRRSSVDLGQGQWPGPETSGLQLQRVTTTHVDGTRGDLAQSAGVTEEVAPPDYRIHESDASSITHQHIQRSSPFCWQPQAGAVSLLDSVAVFLAVLWACLCGVGVCPIGSCVVDSGAPSDATGASGSLHHDLVNTPWPLLALDRAVVAGLPVGASVLFAACSLVLPRGDS